MASALAKHLGTTSKKMHGFLKNIFFWQHITNHSYRILDKKCIDSANRLVLNCNRGVSSSIIKYDDS